MKNTREKRGFKQAKGLYIHYLLRDNENGGFEHLNFKEFQI